MTERISITKAEARVYLRALGDASSFRHARIPHQRATCDMDLLQRQARRYERAAESLRRKIAATEVKG